MCGTGEWEWEEDRRAYSPVERFCHGCYLKHIASDDSGSLPGTTIALLPSNSLDNQIRLARMKEEFEQRLQELDDD